MASVVCSTKSFNIITRFRSWIRLKYASFGDERKCTEFFIMYPLCDGDWFSSFHLCQPSFDSHTHTRSPCMLLSCLRSKYHLRIHWKSLKCCYTTKLPLDFLAYAFTGENDKQFFRFVKHWQRCCCCYKSAQKRFASCFVFPFHSFFYSQFFCTLNRIHRAL